MFAGDKSRPPSDASYRNLLWENVYVDHSLNIGTKILRNKHIGTISSWGPFFRVSFDLIIHSLNNENAWWSSVLSFLGNGGTSECIEIGDCMPAIFLTQSGGLEFYSSVNDNAGHFFDFQAELNHWYNIIIEQKSVNGKVINMKINSTSFNIF